MPDARCTTGVTVDAASRSMLFRLDSNAPKWAAFAEDLRCTAAAEGLGVVATIGALTGEVLP